MPNLNFAGAFRENQREAKTMKSQNCDIWKKRISQFVITPGCSVGTFYGRMFINTPDQSLQERRP